MNAVAGNFQAPDSNANSLAQAKIAEQRRKESRENLDFLLGLLRSNYKKPSAGEAPAPEQKSESEAPGEPIPPLESSANTASLLAKGKMAASGRRPAKPEPSLISEGRGEAYPTALADGTADLVGTLDEKMSYDEYAKLSPYEKMIVNEKMKLKGGFND